MRYYNDKEITKELPIIKEQRGYEPLKNNEALMVQFPLTDEQIAFVDMFAKRNDLCFQAALNRVWRDALSLLRQSISIGDKYSTARQVTTG